MTAAPAIGLAHPTVIPRNHGETPDVAEERTEPTRS
jgi:hypothetical protein